MKNNFIKYRDLKIKNSKYKRSLIKSFSQVLDSCLLTFSIKYLEAVNKKTSYLISNLLVRI